MHHVLGTATHLSQFCLSQRHLNSGLKLWKREKTFSNGKLPEEMISNVSSPPVVAGTAQPKPKSQSPASAEAGEISTR